MKNFVSHQIFVIVTGTCDTFYTPNLLFQFCFLRVFFFFSGVGVKIMVLLWPKNGNAKVDSKKLSHNSGLLLIVIFKTKQTL